MKTPREILLQKHQAAMPALNKIRAEVLRTEVAGEKEETPLFFTLQTLWAELILPSRRIWAGLACAWIAVIILHGAASPDESKASAKTSLSEVTPETRMALQAQQKLFAELLNEQQQRPASPRPPADNPRSERRPSLRSA